jgi:hypothetical protein
MRDPFEQLEASHRRQEEVLRELHDAVTRGDAEGIDEALHFLGRAVPRHFADEEESLFTRVPPSDDLARLIAEHREHEALVDELRHSPDPAPVVAALEALHARHVALEDRVFPALRAGLTAADLDAMAAEMESRRGRGGGRRG